MALLYFYKLQYSLFTTIALKICFDDHIYIYILFFRSAYILNQESLPISYKSFLNKHGGKDQVILQGVKQIACGMPFTNLEEIEKYYKALGTSIKLDPEMKVPCSVCIPVFIVLLFYQVIILHLVHRYAIQFINQSNKVIKLGAQI